MATATVSPQNQVAGIERELAALREDAAKLEADLATLDRDKYRVSERELPVVLHNKELTNANLDRTRAKMAEKQSVLDGLWKRIRDAEAEERRNAAVREVEKLQTETIAAIARLAAKLEGDTDLPAISRGLSELHKRRVCKPDTFPIPPDHLAAGEAYNDCVAKIKPVFDRLQELMRPN